jgi:hypothetical protein
MRRIAWGALVVATAVLAFGAAGANGSPASATAARSAAALTPAATGQVVVVRYQINSFARQGKRLIAKGTAIASYTSPTTGERTVVKRAFKARVALRSHQFSAQRICPILDLTLGPLHLNLLGLIVDLDRVHLTITADSEGGLLGSLLCSLSGTRSSAARIAKLTKLARRSGLATRGIAFAVPLQQTSSGTASQFGAATPLGPAAPARICPVLDLTLGPLDLNLLGLMVHLDTVHLVITADSEGGILGSLFCSLAGGGGSSP